MKHEINITEEDIYRFVFSPETLLKDKFDYLSSNREQFKNEIALCLDLKNNSNDVEVKSFTDKIMQKIYSPGGIVLFPQVNKPIEKNGVKLAAASVLKEKKSNSMSFTDPKSKYLIRIVETEKQTLLYLFSEDKSKHDFQLTIHPSKTQYQIIDLSKPIEILYEKVIEKILIS